MTAPAIALLLGGFVADQAHMSPQQSSLVLEFAAIRDGDLGTLTVKSIKENPDSKDAKGKSRIKIEVQNSQRFHIGELDWCLSIDQYQLRWPMMRSSDHRVLTWVVSEDEWVKLKDGAPMFMTWGCYDAVSKGEKPFAKLDKRSLIRSSPTK